tara:strand:- start:4378 stop:5034 length:657 start_codon:yes stop_codon:yes gene_type:complete
MRAKKKYQSGGSVSASTKYYRENPEARKKKNAYNTEYHSTPSRIKYRAELNQKNRDAGTYGNGDGQDYDHTEGRFMDQSRNRAKDRPVKKAQNGMYLPPKIRSMQEDYINPGGMIQESTVTAPIYKGPVTASTVHDYNKAVGNPTSVHALKSQDPIFDLVGGLGIKVAAKNAPKAFELSKSALNYVKQNPTFVGKHLGKIIGVAKAADQINDIIELNE